ncbi:MAG TPA: carbon starvation protein A [Aigarchaeota archaeon]|nr:carbon starvation protein A [Aigarchaeota archaeon]
MAIHNTPFTLVAVGLLIYALAYWGYSKAIDRKIWNPDPARPTPAHTYADGVEFFPVGRYVLYGFQFNSIAALGPILGPGIALIFGWLPAFLWIILAALLIGWVQDYSALFLSVRNEGKSFGPLAYELIGPTARKLLLGFLLFYFLLINAAFIFVVAVVIDVFPSSFWSLLFLVAAAFITGHLVFNVRMNIIAVTAIAIALLVAGIVVGTLFAWPPPGSLTLGGRPGSPYTLWLVPIVIILLLGSLLPLPRLITPMNYIAYYPVIVAIVALTIGALASPLTGIEMAVPAFKGFEGTFRSGPLWPALFVAIACGAISGWHSLISTGISSRQLDVETDARPVGAGAMLTENTVGLTALAAWVVLAPERVSPVIFPQGATKMVAPIAGGEAAAPFINTFFSIYMVFMAITILTILGRYWRVVMAEVFSDTSLSILGNKYVASVLGFVLPIAFVLTGSWINIWLYFGGTNQLLAGFALTIVAVYLLQQRKSASYSLIPGIFMMITTLAAIAYQVYVFFVATTQALLLHPTQNILKEAAGIGAVQAINAFSVAVGIIMFVLGISMFILLLKALSRAKATAVKPAQ